MHLACIKNNYEMVIFLFEFHPIIDKLDNLGYTPLYYALLNKNHLIATVYIQIYFYQNKI